ncbi:PRD domain-containing protein [Williamsoniiplasma luminosum]|uniref:PRD domain-containing protein n=1 Tax=Williamsoniiplasma luminosum TaxID=214888 RepID=A0A2S0NK35_9MOLU|nr:PRD domain-containing protein [Williamsoniiplasma luminosum]AVP49376.1 MAG: hypothetical protein C5T88_02140 [Williamsoniiplasma luminosum]
MKIQKILNNNAILALNDNSEEIIIIGKGIGFQQNPTNLVNKNLIEKMFVNTNTKNFKYIKSNFSNISEKYIIVVQKIINIALQKLNKPINDMIYANLINHLQFAIERYFKKIPILNTFFREIKMYYPEEFEIGVKSLEIVKEEFGVDLGIEEASFIAVYLVDAELEHDSSKVIMLTEIIDAISKVIYYDLEISADNSEDYDKFILHVKQLIMNIIYEMNQDLFNNNFQEIYEVLMKQYPKEYECVIKIKNYILKKFKVEINNDECTYLMIHLIKLSSNY